MTPEGISEERFRGETLDRLLCHLGWHGRYAAGALKRASRSEDFEYLFNVSCELSTAHESLLLCRTAAESAPELGRAAFCIRNIYRIPDNEIPSELAIETVANLLLELSGKREGAAFDVR